jgi:predicted hotdog family 3-hydroxylacyl-ACP dehydratase
MEFPDIASLVQHQAPMLLLDRLLDVTDDGLCAEVTIGPDSLFCTAQGVGAWIGIEYMAQAIAAYAGYQRWKYQESSRIGFLLGTRCYDCSVGWFATGSILQVEVKQLLQTDNGLGSFSCTIKDRVLQRQLAQASVSVFQPPDASAFLEGKTA